MTRWGPADPVDMIQRDEHKRQRRELDKELGEQTGQPAKVSLRQQSALANRLSVVSRSQIDAQDAKLPVICDHSFRISTSGRVSVPGCGSLNRNPASLVNRATGERFCRKCGRVTIHVPAGTVAETRVRVHARSTPVAADMLLSSSGSSLPFWLCFSRPVTKRERFSTALTDLQDAITEKLNARARIEAPDDSKRCALLVDLVTTTSTISTGLPHRVANALYDFIERVHEDKLFVRFAFVGITDNAHVLAGRDVFCRDASGPFAAHDKRPFAALDGQHMFAVLPEGEEFASSERRLECTTALVALHRARTSVLRSRRETSRYVPPVHTPGGNPAIKPFAVTTVGSAYRRERPTSGGSATRSRSASPTPSSSPPRGSPPRHAPSTRRSPQLHRRGTGPSPPAGSLPSPPITDSNHPSRRVRVADVDDDGLRESRSALIFSASDALDAAGDAITAVAEAPTAVDAPSDTPAEDDGTPPAPPARSGDVSLPPLF